MTALQLNGRLNTTTIPSNGQPRLLYLLLGTGISGHTNAFAAVNLALVVDASDSMRIRLVNEEQFRRLAAIGQVQEIMTDGVPAWQMQNLPRSLIQHFPRKLDAYRVKPVISQIEPAALSAGASHAGSYTIPVGDIEQSAPPAFLLELIVPPRGNGRFRIAQLLLSSAPVGANRQTVRQNIIVEFAAAPGPDDPYIMNIVERVTAFQLQTRALEAIASGDFGSATRRLQAAAARLLEMGENELAQTLQQQAETLAQQAQPDAQATQAATLRNAPPDAKIAMSVCPQCAFANRDSATFCAQCGLPLHSCPFCNAAVRPGTRFCQRCGQALPHNTFLGSSASACPVCGRGNQAGAQFCRHCGAPLTAVLTIPCPACGYALKPGARFCPQCGLAQGAQTGMKYRTGKLPPDTLLRGSEGATYLVLGLVARGGMGAVYKVMRSTDQSVWALKEMSESAVSAEEWQKTVATFYAEAHLLQSLAHENLPNHHLPRPETRQRDGRGGQQSRKVD